MTRVVIADDHLLVRAGIAALLGDLPEVTVVGQAGDGLAAVNMASELRPDILFLDVDMPGMSGLEALALIRLAQAEVRVIILSLHDSEEHVLRALKLGAAGFMLKDSAPEELAQAIKAVNQGRIWLSAAVSPAVISAYVERSASRGGQSPPSSGNKPATKLPGKGCAK